MSAKFNEGDEVYVSSREALRRETITRVTKTQAVIEHERHVEKFNRETGRQIGGSDIGASCLHHPNEHLDKKWRQARVDAARRVLAEYARRDEPEKIRAAFAKWDRLDRKESS